MSDPAPIVCLSHLAWERTLFQRPQQIMTRFVARGHDVLYLSRISSRRWLSHRFAGRGDLLRSRPGESPRWRNRPFVPAWNSSALLRGVDERWSARIARRWLAGRGESAVLWLEHPTLVGLANRIPHRGLVYDAMDPFKSFRNSQSRALDQESDLLRRADVVFTGGLAMHEAVAERRPDAHCFSSGVDVEHFARARDPGTEIATELRDLPRPVLGYFGAVDERMDSALLQAICRLRPNWSVVLLGPLIQGTEIPITEPNFHWLGPKPYDALPSFLRGFDVCLIPWVKSELTDALSPTKTPEYLAGGKPVVSVRIRDVVRNYSDICLFAETPEQWVAACEHAMADGRDWAASIVGHPHARTWDEIVAEMAELII